MTESYDEYKRRMKAESEHGLRTKGIRGGTADGRFYNRFPEEPKTRSELRQQQRAAATLRHEGIDRDIARFDGHSREASNTASTFRKLERQAEENWRFLPSQLVQKHKRPGENTYDVASMKSEIHNRRLHAEDQTERCESISRSLRDGRDAYERERRGRDSSVRKWSAAGAVAGEMGTAAAGGLDFGTLPIASSVAARSLAKSFNDEKARKSAYEEMSATRQAYRKAGYRPGKY